MKEKLKAARERAARLNAEAIKLRDEYKIIEKPTAENLEKLEKAVAEFSTAQQELQRIEALAGRDDELDKFAELHRKAVDDKSGHQSDQRETAAERSKRIHKEAFTAYLRRGEKGLEQFCEENRAVAAEEVFALLSTDQTLGGFLVPDDFQAGLLAALKGFTAIRPLARIQPTTRDVVVWPRKVKHATDSRKPSGFVGTWRKQGYVTGGTAPTVQNQPTFAQERIPVNDWQPDAVEISPQLLEDSAVNVDLIVQEAIAETLGFDEDDAFLNGTGIDQPEGILQAGVSTVITGSASALAYNGVVNLYTGLPAQYRPNSTFMMNSGTYGAALQLADSQLRPLLGLVNGQIVGVPSLFGRPIVFHENMANVAAGSSSIIYGNFQYYLIVERQGLRVQRLVERFAPNIGYLPVARIGGQVVQVDAFRVQLTSA